MSDSPSHKTLDDERGVHDRILLIGDLIRYFSQLASLNGSQRTGNFELSDGLKQLTKALRPYNRRTIPEFVEFLKDEACRSQGSSRTEKASLPPGLESLSQKEIEEILGNEKCTKSQIIEIGTRRFGIPQSKLSRSNKEEVLKSVHAALDHERSLDVISIEASRAVRAS